MWSIEEGRCHHIGEISHGRWRGDTPNRSRGAAASMIPRATSDDFASGAASLNTKCAERSNHLSVLFGLALAAAQMHILFASALLKWHIACADCIFLLHMALASFLIVSVQKYFSSQLFFYEIGE